MRYLIYEDAVTHKFAFFPLPPRFVEGEELPSSSPIGGSILMQEAIAALPELFNRDDSEAVVPVQATGSAEEIVMPVNPRRPH